jgi:prepilin-type N-terminal cleavage/methylation domain-containing protein
MKINRPTGTAENRRAGQPAFTLIEVVIATAIAALVLAGMFQGYNLAGRKAQYSACSLAANSTAMRQLEQCIGASWVPASGIMTLLNQNGSYSTNLCLPSAQGNVVNCTVNYSATQISSNPPYAMIQAQCVWTFPTYGGTYTNTVAVLRAPNQ